MRRILLLLSAFVFCLAVNAGQDKDFEDHHVSITLMDGTVKEGYIVEYWTDGGLFKRMNTSFSMSETAGGEAKIYDAESVKSIDFIKKLSDDGRYDHLESHVVANPSTFKPKKTQRQFIYKEGGNAVGTIYWWNGVDSQNMQLGRMNISTIYGVCLAGDSVVVPFMTGNVVSLNAMRIRYKKTRRALVDYVDKRVLKGGSKLWGALASNPMLFLELCGEYYKAKEGEQK